MVMLNKMHRKRGNYRIPYSQKHLLSTMHVARPLRYTKMKKTMVGQREKYNPKYIFTVFM